MLAPILAAVVLAATPAAQPAPSPVIARPFLVALSVGDLDRSIGWYGRHLGFKLIERRRFEDYHLSLAFMEAGGFRLELVQLDGSKPRRTAQPDPDNSASLQGLAKLGFMVDDPDAVVAAMKDAGTPVVVAPQSDVERGLRSAIVADPDGNAVQLFRKLS